MPGRARGKSKARVKRPGGKQELSAADLLNKLMDGGGGGKKATIVMGNSSGKGPSTATLPPPGGVADSWDADSDHDVVETGTRQWASSSSSFKDGSVAQRERRAPGVEASRSYIKSSSGPVMDSIKASQVTLASSSSSVQQSSILSSSVAPTNSRLQSAWGSSGGASVSGKTTEDSFPPSLQWTSYDDTMKEEEDSAKPSRRSLQDDSEKSVVPSGRSNPADGSNTWDISGRSVEGAHESAVLDSNKSVVSRVVTKSSGRQSEPRGTDKSASRVTDEGEGDEKWAASSIVRLILNSSEDWDDSSSTERSGRLLQPTNADSCKAISSSSDRQRSVNEIIGESRADNTKMQSDEGIEPSSGAGSPRSQSGQLGASIVASHEAGSTKRSNEEMSGVGWDSNTRISQGGARSVSTSSNASIAKRQRSRSGDASRESASTSVSSSLQRRSAKKEEEQKDGGDLPRSRQETAASKKRLIRGYSRGSQQTRREEVLPPARGEGFSRPLASRSYHADIEHLAQETGSRAYESYTPSRAVRSAEGRRGPSASRQARPKSHGPADPSLRQDTRPPWRIGASKAHIPEVPPPVVSRASPPRTRARYMSPGNPSKELTRWDCLAAGYSSEGLKHKHRHHNDADGSNRMHHLHEAKRRPDSPAQEPLFTDESMNYPGAESIGNGSETAPEGSSSKSPQVVPQIPIATADSPVCSWNPVPGGPPAAAIVFLNPEALRELSWMVPGASEGAANGSSPSVTMVQNAADLWHVIASSAARKDIVSTGSGPTPRPLGHAPSSSISLTTDPEMPMLEMLSEEPDPGEGDDGDGGRLSNPKGKWSLLAAGESTQGMVTKHHHGVHQQPPAAPMVVTAEVHQIAEEHYASRIGDSRVPNIEASEDSTMSVNSVGATGDTREGKAIPETYSSGFDKTELEVIAEEETEGDVRQTDREYPGMTDSGIFGNSIDSVDSLNGRANAEDPESSGYIAATYTSRPAVESDMSGMIPTSSSPEERISTYSSQSFNLRYPNRSGSFPLGQPVVSPRPAESQDVVQQSGEVVETVEYTEELTVEKAGQDDVNRCANHLEFCCQPRHSKDEQLAGWEGQLDAYVYGKENCTQVLEFLYASRLSAWEQVKAVRERVTGLLNTSNNDNATEGSDGEDMASIEEELLNGASAVSSYLAAHAHFTTAVAANHADRCFNRAIQVTQAISIGRLASLGDSELRTLWLLAQSTTRPEFRASAFNYIHKAEQYLALAIRSLESALSSWELPVEPIDVAPFMDAVVTDHVRDYRHEKLCLRALMELLLEVDDSVMEVGAALGHNVLHLNDTSLVSAYGFEHRYSESSAITRGAVSFEPAIVHEAVDLPYGPFDWGLVMNVLSLVSDNSSSRADELSSLLRNIGANTRKGVVLFAWRDLVNYAEIEEVGARFIDAKLHDEEILPPADLTKDLYDNALAAYQPKHGKQIASAHRTKGDDNENAEPNPDQVHDPSLTYGETSLQPMRTLMAAVERTVTVVPGSTSFLDIGSGAGTAVLAAATCHPFRKAVGLECVPELVAKSNELKDSLSSVLFPSGEDGTPAAEPAVPGVTSNIEFIEGEAFEEIPKLLGDGSDFVDPALVLPVATEELTDSGNAEADTLAEGHPENDASLGDAQPVKPNTPLIIYWLSTCFNEDLVQSKALCLAQDTPKDTVLVLVTHLLRRDAARVWYLEDEVEIEFDWGVGTVFIYRNVTEKTANEEQES
ncbi:hypothetical protein FOZ61_003170 [Perkinsus olseni]|uniref:DOT1 domain-containing protein n=1 Tax=Perkinsus olseni TaxID=32597 RepID=A0A7J6LRC8_PEROL|nr:hypothetical protein FOZ61_003170 [Perkinsus olseni]